MPARIDGKGHSWADRKKKFKSIQIRRDLAETLIQIAAADGVALHVLIDGLMRATAEERLKQVSLAALDRLKKPAAKRESARR